MSFLANPLVVFFIGISILALFLWYFATDSSNRKRGVGTLLTFVLTAFCLAIIYPPSKQIKKGIDLQGGSSFVVQLVSDPGSEKTIDATAVQNAVSVIEKRLNPEGNKDLLIAPQGEDRILVQMPGITPEAVKEVTTELLRPAKLDFSIVHPQSPQRAQAVLDGKDVVPGYVPKPDMGAEPDAEGDHPPVLVKVRPDMTGNVKRAFAQLTPEGWIVQLEFNDEGSKRFDEIAQQHYQEQLAIILDGEVQQTPTLQAKFFNGRATISGRYSAEEARNLASILENPLENEMEILNSYEVSPTMGKETIRQGIFAGVAGLGVTLIFLVLYYKFAGIVALIGLSVNIILLFGALAMFEFTLTLPGIAGIILTIGIAIDANVLIYERLREELKGGKSLGNAIDTAYGRAFSAIFDANITTLIAAIILFAVASGTVKGFAITLTLGILASLFSALIVTRLCFGWALSSGILKNLKLKSLVPEGSINFLGKGKATLAASAVVVTIMVATLAFKGENALGVDFRGATSSRCAPPVTSR